MTDITRIKLFHYPATRSARVKWMLHEVLDDDFDVERVSLYDGDQYSENYKAINPNHCVPALQLTLADGSLHHMGESGAIVEWLADAFPQRRLAPAAQGPSLARADYLHMLHFASTTVDRVLLEIRIHQHLLPESECDPRMVTRYRDKFINEVQPQLQTRLQASPFICGRDFTAADVLVGHCVMWARTQDLCNAGPFKNYIGRLAERPAFLKGFADAAEFTPAVPEDKPLRTLFTG